MARATRQEEMAVATAKKRLWEMVKRIAEIMVA